MEHVYKGQRASGRIKTEPEDFVVEEITESGAVLEAGRVYSSSDVGMADGPDGSNFTVFVMQKRSWNTAQALRTLAKRVGRGIKSASFAGTKDRNAVTTQLCSIFGVRPEAVLSAHVKDIAVNGAWFSEKQVKMGDLAGNRFTVRVRSVADSRRIGDALSELSGRFPNYFGPQRFGSRGNNAAIGVLMLKQDFEGAVRMYLTDSVNETNASAVEARKRLAGEWDFTSALRYFPRHLRYEASVIEYLSRFPGNYANALRKLPRSILLMFVHAVEAEIFNSVLEARIRSGTFGPVEGDIVCGADGLGFPDYSSAHAFVADADKAFVIGNILGHDTMPNPQEREILDGLGIGPEMFKVKGMPELNAKGAQRVLFAPYTGMRHSESDSDATLAFSLPAGSYATSLLTELVDSAPASDDDSPG